MGDCVKFVSLADDLADGCEDSAWVGVGGEVEYCSAEGVTYAECGSDCIVAYL